MSRHKTRKLFRVFAELNIIKKIDPFIVPPRSSSAIHRNSFVTHSVKLQRDVKQAIAFINFENKYRNSVMNY